MDYHLELRQHGLYIILRCHTCKGTTAYDVPRVEAVAPNHMWSKNALETALRRAEHGYARHQQLHGR